MKQSIDLTSPDVSMPVREFVRVWKQKKNYTNLDQLTGMECLELNVAVTYNLHYENSDGRFFNKIISNKESVIAWEGDEFIDTLWFDTQKSIQQRLASGTFNSEIPS